MSKYFPIFLKSLGLALLGFGLASCQSGVQVKVDAVSKPDVEQSIAYQIKTTNPDLDPDTLRFKEAERFVKTALSGKGMYEAPKPEMADMVVDIDYGISPPKISQEVHSEAMYETVPGPLLGYRMVDVADQKTGKISTLAIPIYGPDTQRYLGDREYTETVITYEKYLRLKARENKPLVEGQPATELWTVDVSTEGENRDLRKALPALAAATIEYVGKDTRGEKVIRLKDNDKNGPIAFVKKGM